MDPRRSSDTFSAGQVCRYSDIPYRTLDYWSSSGLIPASVHEHEGKGTWRGYSFRDLIFLRVARRVRESGLSLHGIRLLQRCLQQHRHLEAPPADTYVVTNGRDVCTILRGQRAVWTFVTTPARRSLPWLVLDLSQTVKEVCQAILAERESFSEPV